MNWRPWAAAAVMGGGLSIWAIKVTASNQGPPPPGPTLGERFRGQVRGSGLAAALPPHGTVGYRDDTPTANPREAYEADLIHCQLQYHLVPVVLARGGDHQPVLVRAGSRFRVERRAGGRP